MGTDEADYGAIIHAGEMFQKHLDKTELDKANYTPEGFKDQIAQFAKTDAALAVDKAVENAQSRVESALAKADKVRAGLSPDGDTAAELRATRYWNRTKGVLDANQTSAHSLAQKLIGEATREELGTLLQELPTYLQTIGAPTSWLDEYIARAIPEYGATKAEVDQATHSLQLIQAAAKFVRDGIANGRAPNKQVLDMVNPSTARRPARRY
ncbi:MAG: hypothetical protein HYZ38_05070 [Mycobacterium sp.]|nr:hypothetical protein [Mycobacterium sp.]